MLVESILTFVFLVVFFNIISSLIHAVQISNINKRILYVKRDKKLREKYNIKVYPDNI